MTKIAATTTVTATSGITTIAHPGNFRGAGVLLGDVCSVVEV